MKNNDVPAQSSPKLPTAFHLLWAGETVSLFGTQITMVALPLTAVVLLDAGPFEMGLLNAAGWLPILLFGLLAGALVDRVDVWRILFASNLARGLLLALVPLLAVLDGLSFGTLVAVAILLGIANVLFDVAFQTFVPSIVDDENLGLANSRYELSRSISQLTGPLVGGALAAAILPAYVLGLDALTFLVAAVGLWFIPRLLPPAPAKSTDEPTDRKKSSFIEDMKEGLSLIWQTKSLRLVVAGGAGINVFIAGIDALLIVFITRTLDLGAVVVGFTLALAGGGAIIGALCYSRLAAKIGEPRCVAFGIATFTVGAILIPASTLFDGGAVIAVLLVSQAVFGLGNPILNIALVTMRQKLTPRPLLGRVNASARVLIMSSLPVGALAGGGIAELTGITNALWIMCVGLALVSAVLGPAIARLSSDLDASRR